MKEIWHSSIASIITSTELLRSVAKFLMVNPKPIAKNVASLSPRKGKKQFPVARRALVANPRLKRRVKIPLAIAGSYATITHRNTN
jgi:hypothetical protein